MSKVLVTRVGDPANPQTKENGSTDAGVIKREDGSSFSWYQLQVAQKRGLRTTVANRNFIADTNDGLDRDAAVEAMEEKTDVGGNHEDALQVVSVDIAPRPVIINGEQQTDGDGNPVFQTSANIIVLPGETVRQALKQTNRDFTLLEDADRETAPATEPAEDEMADAAL